MSFDLNRVIRGRVWKFGDSVDTDSINPYYRYPTMEELKKHKSVRYVSVQKNGDSLVLENRSVS